MTPNNEPINMAEAELMLKTERGRQRRQEVIDRHKEIMANKTLQEREQWALETLGPEALKNPIWRFLAGIDDSRIKEPSREPFQ